MTTSHFKYGDTREDGYRFRGRRVSRPKKDGTYGEVWVNPESYEKHIQDGKKQKKESMILLAN